MNGAKIARVLLDSPVPQLDQPFDYLIPEMFTSRVEVGTVVRVPLRGANRIATGWVVGLPETSEFSGRLSPLIDVVSEVPLLSEGLWKLASMVAERSAGGVSDILRTAIPPRYVRVEKAWKSNQGDPGSLPTTAVPIRGYPAGSVEAALKAGERFALFANPIPVVLPATTTRESETVGAWAVTIAEAAVHMLRDDRSTIIAVPDHRDLNQVLAALDRFVDPRRVLRTDTGQTGGERYRAFLAGGEDHARIIVGNRSVVYAPAPRLGLIAVWDDGDPLYSEPLTPGVNTRDVALLRKTQSGAALMFIGHTRSVEVQRFVELEWVTEIASAGHVKPKTVLAQFRDDEVANSARIPSVVWQAAQQALTAGPVLVLVSQPGHIPVVMCSGCNKRARCSVCHTAWSASSSSKANDTCKVCGIAQHSWNCEHCDGRSMRAFAVGGRRTAEDLGKSFPKTRVVISDGEHVHLSVGSEPALVVATRGAEPVAEGGYRAVVLLDGERLLMRETLRVAEDCLRLWSNSAALAAPQAPVFLVGVEGAIGTAFATWRQAEWARHELAERRLLRFPPAIRVASIAGDHSDVAQFTDAIRDGVAEILGPSQMPDGKSRAILRFTYANGAEVARAVRSEIIHQSMRRKRNIRGVPAQTRLRVRFDDRDAF